MKKIPILLLTALMLFILCSCGNTTPQDPSAPVASDSTPTQNDAPVPQPNETLPPAKTVSIMASTLQPDATGILWSTYPEADGLRSVYDLLPEDTGYVGNLCFSGDTLYVTVKDYNFSMDPAALYAVDIATGQMTLLAENVSPDCVFCTLGNDIILYSGERGLWTVSLTTGQTAQVSDDSAQLLAARDGHAYYTKGDGILWRSDSNFAQEEKLIEDLSSSWICPGEATLCTLVYNDEGTIAAVEFRALDGTLQSRQPLDEVVPVGFYARENTLYVPQVTAQTVLAYDMTTAQLTKTLPLEGEAASCQILFADEDSLYYKTLEGGTFSLYRMVADGSETQLLLTDLPV